MPISVFESDAGSIRDQLMECCSGENIENAVIALSDIVAGSRRSNEQLIRTTGNLGRAIATVNLCANNNYTEIIRGFGVINDRIEAIEKRIERLENRKHEQTGD